MVLFNEIIINLAQEQKKYYKYIRLFINFLHIKNINENDMLSLEVIEQSIIYQCEKYKISSKDTLVTYLKAITLIFDYWSRKTSLTNPLDQIDSLVNYSNQVIQKKDVVFQTISEADFFNEVQLIELLKALVEYDYQSLLDGSTNGYKKYIRYKTLCILLKIMMIAPTRKKLLTWLKINAIDMSARVIQVQGVHFDIPSHLFYEIQDYLSVRLQYNEENGIDDDYFFIHSPKLKRVKDSDFNIWFGEFIYETGVFDIELKTTDNGFSYCTFRIAPVKDAVLYQMVCHGAPLSLIAHIDDRDIASVAKKFNIKPKNMDELANAALKQSDYYKYL